MNKDKIHILARGVIINDKRILLCKTMKLKENFYFLPGGHIEHNENAEAALIRELLEESGHIFTLKRFLGCLENIFIPEPQNTIICHSHEYNLIFEVGSTTLSATVPPEQLEEGIKLEWILLNEINNMDLRPSILKTLINKWLDLKLNEAFHN